MEWDSSSILFKMEAPVVVNPEIVSKKASVKRGMLLLSQKGRDPNNEKIIHAEVTTSEPSRLPTDIGAFFPKKKPAKPTT